MSTLAERLAAAMEGRKQTDLAKACGIKPPSVNDWLTGKTKRMDGVHLVKACAFLRVRPRWLALGEGPMRDDEPKGELPELVAAWLKQCRPDLL